MGSYLSSTPAAQREMLAKVGCATLEELFAELPQEVLLKAPLALAKGLSEVEVRREVEKLADKNRRFPTIFRGAGAYRHYIPSIVKQITSKEEFVTAYTPYQAEISQGILHSIFEYQTMICELTGMDASNASVYDVASAAAETAAMCRDRKRGRMLISGAVQPDVIETVKTYCFGSGMELAVIPVKDGRTDADALGAMLDSTVACVLVQHPNYYGVLEDARALGEAAHAAGAKYILSCNPLSLAVLETPAALGADVAIGDGQPLGLPLSFGGPYVGFMAAKSDMVRKLPGRIVGQTTDHDGRRAFVLTLQAREQHIRREKASSNICSNQALCAMTTTVYLAAMGAEGIADAASGSAAHAHYLADRLAEAGYPLAFSAPFFHEFVTFSPVAPATLEKALADRGILGGLPIQFAGRDAILWCATELNTREEMDAVAAIAKEVAGK